MSAVRRCTCPIRTLGSIGRHAACRGSTGPWGPLIRGDNSRRGPGRPARAAKPDDGRAGDQPRPALELEGGTTFHFLDVPPEEALALARDAADGQDVRIGGGPTMLREFLAAGLVDHLHVVQVPILLGRGVRLWDGLTGLDEQYA